MLPNATKRRGLWQGRAFERFTDWIQKCTLGPPVAGRKPGLRYAKSGA